MTLMKNMYWAIRHIHWTIRVQ